MSSKHGIFFRMEINIPLVIQGLLASFFLLPTKTFERSMLIDDFSDYVDKLVKCLIKIVTIQRKIIWNKVA